MSLTHQAHASTDANGVDCDYESFHPPCGFRPIPADNPAVRRLLTGPHDDDSIDMDIHFEDLVDDDVFEDVDPADGGAAPDDSPEYTPPSSFRWSMGRRRCTNAAHTESGPVRRLLTGSAEDSEEQTRRVPQLFDGGDGGSNATYDNTALEHLHPPTDEPAYAGDGSLTTNIYETLRHSSKPGNVLSSVVSDADTEYDPLTLTDDVADVAAGGSVAHRAANDDDSCPLSVAEAIEAYRRAVDDHPGWSRAWFDLGRAYDDLGNTSAARDAFGQAVLIDPTDAEAWRHLALTAIAQADTCGAERALREAVRHDPTNAQGWLHLGNVLSERGRSAAAKKAWAACHEVDPSFS